jgi:hypothetical protein
VNFVFDGAVVAGLYVAIGLLWAGIILAVVLPLIWTYHFVQRRRHIK